MPEKIYITYPIPEDNSSINQEMIDSFIGHFIDTLNQYVNEEIKYIIKGVDFGANNFQKYIDKKNIYVLLQFDLQNGDDYIREINQITEIRNIDSYELSKGMTGIFKACLTPCSYNPNDLFSRILPYNFFELNRYNRKFKSYFHEEEGLPDAYWAKLLDMVVDITAYITVKNSSADDESTTGRYVFMAESTPDQSTSRDEIIRELKHFGFKILPSVQFPEEHEEIEKMILDSLEHCKYAIQLFGLHYGNILKNTKYSFIDFQNRIISDYQKNNPQKNLKRFIWIPGDLKTTDQRQNLYLRRIKRDEAGEKTEIIEAPVEVFKTAILRAMQEDNEEKGHPEKQKKVYLIFEEKEKQAAAKWVEKLNALSVKPVYLDYTSQVGIYARHLQNLSNSDAVMIYIGKSDEMWLRSKIRDLVKVTGYIEDKRFKAIGVILNNSTKNRMTEYFDEKIDIISEDLPGNEQLDEFISKLK